MAAAPMEARRLRHGHGVVQSICPDRKAGKATAGARTRVREPLVTRASRSGATCLATR